jgi:hypothetical protein
MKANTDENLNQLKLNVEDIKMTNRRTNLEQQHQIQNPNIIVQRRRRQNEQQLQRRN